MKKAAADPSIGSENNSSLWDSRWHQFQIAFLFLMKYPHKDIDKKPAIDFANSSGLIEENLIRWLHKWDKRFLPCADYCYGILT